MVTKVTFPQYIVIFVTCPNPKEANKIASALVNEKLAACVNIISNLNSVFRWQGKIDRSQELLLMIKTKKKLFAKVERLVKKHHSYDTAEIIALPIVGGSKRYLKWIKESTIL